jgi:hypothetical protein
MLDPSCDISTALLPMSFAEVVRYWEEAVPGRRDGVVSIRMSYEDIPLMI